jgi:hypothetical protein
VHRRCPLLPGPTDDGPPSCERRQTSRSDQLHIGRRTLAELEQQQMGDRGLRLCERAHLSRSQQQQSVSTSACSCVPALNPLRNCRRIAGIVANPSNLSTVSDTFGWTRRHGCLSSIRSPRRRQVGAQRAPVLANGQFTESIQSAVRQHFPWGPAIVEVGSPVSGGLLGFETAERPVERLVSRRGHDRRGPAADSGLGLIAENVRDRANTDIVFPLVGELTAEEPLPPIDQTTEFFEPHGLVIPRGNLLI